MRRSFFAPVLLLALAPVLFAPGAGAGPTPVTGQLQIRDGLDIENNPLIFVILGGQAFSGIPLALAATGVATPVGGAHLASLYVPASLVTGTVSAVDTDPAHFPIDGIELAAVHGAGHFSTGGGDLAGTMPLQGVYRQCLFGVCSGAPAANIEVPLSFVGVGGTTHVTGIVNVTVTGAPWTAGVASVAGVTAAGFVHGPASATSSTALASGAVRLVTPIYVSTNIGGANVIPLFGQLDLHFGIPEPGTLALVGGGALALVFYGRTRGR